MNSHFSDLPADQRATIIKMFHDLALFVGTEFDLSGDAVTEAIQEAFAIIK